jgi:biotin synthase
VTSGKKVGKQELKEIASIVRKVRHTGLLPCATLGLLDKDELSLLQDNGLERYHHNLETSEKCFSRICSTHSYGDKMRTIGAAKSLGLSLCSGGIFGIGESWQDRIDMAFALRAIDVDSVPINFLIAVKGTRLEAMERLHPFDALKIVSLYRFVMPEKVIRVCGGRRQTLGGFNSMLFTAGADALLTGNYLTTAGTPYEDDLRLIGQYGLEIERG